MKILLVKCHMETIFSKIEPVVTEPLELEYLSSVCQTLGAEHRLYDSLLEGSSFQEVYDSYQPQVIALTGYITAVDKIKEYAKYAKVQNSQVKVVVGGIHAEVNYEDFFMDAIDIIIHSDGLNTWTKLINKSFPLDSFQLLEVEGIAFQKDGQWHINPKIPTNLETLPLPNRSYFNQYKKNTKYIHYSPIAIVKTALSCPYQCNFCYCRLLNMGIYAPRNIDSVVEEIHGIDAPYIWLVDDTFLIERERVFEFINKLENKGIKKKYIAYSRVDFIVHNEDIIEKLAKVGFVELIVGMEAVDDKLLDTFTKTYTAKDNLQAAAILRKHGINLTGLFIAGIEFTHRDFRNLRRGIRKLGIESYTVSIFTPVKGTQLYQEYKEELLTTDPSRWDFLHLTLKPVHIHWVLFYLQFYAIYGEQFLRSKHIRAFLFKSWRKLLVGGKNG